MKSISKWHLIISLLALLLVVLSYWFTDILATGVAKREARTIREWVTAQKTIANAGPDQDLSLPMTIVEEQQTIPVIETNEKDSILGYLNLDSSKANGNRSFLKQRLQEYGKAGHVIITYLDDEGKRFNRYYYGESVLLKQIRYFPLIQLLVVILFSTLLLISIRNRNKAEQHRLWAGLAKETAHQLATPVSALSGWAALLREQGGDGYALDEMEKDIIRLNLITERFGMIGGVPKLETIDLLVLVEHALDYVRKRASGGIQMEFHPPHGTLQMNVKACAPLLEWVIENLLKNALDALEGRGSVRVEIQEQESDYFIDVTDSGKGMTPGVRQRVFDPGFTTRKRGWGLGLTLAKRIIEEYHKGILMVKDSAPGKGTTFRIILKK